MLHDLQRAFAHHIFHPKEAPPKDVATGKLSPRECMNIYRHNTFYSLKGVLAETFPATVQLVGDGYFEAIAHQFIAQHPPTSGALLSYGGTFPAFLSAHESLADYPYVADIARLEWAWQHAFNAKNAPHLTAEDLAALPLDKLDTLYFTCHPATFVLQSNFPVFTLWQVATNQREQPENFTLNHSEAVAITRPHNNVSAHHIPHDTALFLHEISRGTSASSAAHAVLQRYPHAHLPDILIKIIEIGALTCYAQQGAPQEGDTTHV